LKNFKSKASIISINELPEIYFDLIKNRDEYIINMRYEGHTLQEIGNSVSLSRERIRQIVQLKDGPSTHTVGKIRLVKYRKEIIEIVKQNPNFDRTKLASELEISLAALKKFLGQEIKRLAINQRSSEKKKYSDSDLVNILRDSKPNRDGILTAAYFRKNGGKPTVAVFIARFGSWENACNLAGKKAGKGRSSYNRMHTNWQLLEFVEKYLSENSLNGSAKGYDDWQKNHPFAPSLALLRQRLGKWNDIKKKLSSFID
jgi:hypothetical protein